MITQAQASNTSSLPKASHNANRLRYTYREVSSIGSKHSLRLRKKSGTEERIRISETRAVAANRAVQQALKSIGNGVKPLELCEDDIV